MEQNKDSKHTFNTTMDFIRGDMWKVLDWPSQSPAFHLLNRRLKGETRLKKRKTKNNGPSLEKHHTTNNSLVMSLGCWLATKY